MKRRKICIKCGFDRVLKAFESDSEACKFCLQEEKLIIGLNTYIEIAKPLKYKDNGKRIYNKTGLAATPEGRREQKRTSSHRRLREKTRTDLGYVTYLVDAARWRCKRTGMECTIDPASLVPIPKKCYISGVKLKKFGGPNSPSLDRIDNSKGYIPGNVAIIYQRANTLKNNLTAQQLKRMLDYVENGVPTVSPPALTGSYWHDVAKPSLETGFEE